MSGQRLQLEPRPAFNPMGEGYRYLLLTIIGALSSTVLVLTAASQPTVAATVSGPVATAMPANMLGMDPASISTAPAAAAAPAASAKPVTVNEISRAASDVPPPITSWKGLK